MGDGRKSCFGITSIVLSIVLGLSFGFIAGIGIDWRRGLVVGLGVFVFFFVLGIYFFIKMENWAWLPAIASAIYAILPDFFLGPGDDAGVLVVGALITGVLTYRQENSKNGALPDQKK